MLSELNIINFLQREFPTHIGDDAAVLPFTSSSSYIITKDLLVEDIHFRIRYNDASSVAYKALQANLSDIAAMGSSSLYVMLGVAIPANYELYADIFIKCFSSACKEAGVVLIGGDTTGSTDRFTISVTMIGICDNTNIKLRSTAKVSDIICVIGNLGYAHIGLTALEHHVSGVDFFKDALMRPKAMVKEGKWLGERECVSSMMDLSDGLYSDLSRLCKASSVQAKIDLDKLKCGKKFKAACDVLGLEYTKTQLLGGEDYGLLITVKASEYEELASEFLSNFGYDLENIGEITSGSGVIFTQKNASKILSLQPFSHFNELL